VRSVTRVSRGPRVPTEHPGLLTCRNTGVRLCRRGDTSHTHTASAIQLRVGSPRGRGSCAKAMAPCRARFRAAELSRRSMTLDRGAYPHAPSHPAHGTHRRGRQTPRVGSQWPPQRLPPDPPQPGYWSGWGAWGLFFRFSYATSPSPPCSAADSNVRLDQGIRVWASEGVIRPPASGRPARPRLRRRAPGASGLATARGRSVGAAHRRRHLRVRNAPFSSRPAMNSAQIRHRESIV
jgi:hypothetical protein